MLSGNAATHPVHCTKEKTEKNRKEKTSKVAQDVQHSDEAETSMTEDRGGNHRPQPRPMNNDAARPLGADGTAFSLVSRRARCNLVHKVTIDKLNKITPHQHQQPSASIHFITVLFSPIHGVRLGSNQRAQWRRHEVALRTVS